MVDSITKLIKTEIKRQYKSVRKFSEESGIPYSTLSKRYWSNMARLLVQIFEVLRIVSSEEAA